VPEVPTSAEKQAARLARREAALALRAELSPTGPAPDRFRIATWNLNSLRRRLPAVERFLERARPDVLCLQETKVGALPDEARAVFERHGYEVEHVGANQWNGVALAARHPLDEVVCSGAFGDPDLDRDPRIVAVVVRAPEPVRVVSVYVPHGRAVDHWHMDHKIAFLDALAERCRTWLAAGVPLVVAGDVNVAPTDSDVFHPDAFVGRTHVTPREREAWQRLLDVGLVDVDVARWGARARRFTWWDHGIGYSRNLGMRLDAIAVDRSLAERLDTTWIDHVERGAEGPSDHAALLADLHPASVVPGSGEG